MAIHLYYSDPAAKGKVKKYLVDDIDAHDAVRRFPKEYSLTPPDTAEVDEVLTPQAAMAAGVNIPVAEDQSQTGGPAATVQPPAAA